MNSGSDWSSVGLGRTNRIRSMQLFLLVAFLALLQYVATSGLVGQLTLSPPTAIATTLIELIRNGTILPDVWQTGVAVAIAFFLAVIVGLPCGWLLARIPVLHRILAPYLVAYYALPVFAFYPLLIAIFGLNRIPIILIAFAMSVIAIVINTVNGFNRIPEVFMDVSRSMRLSRAETFVHVQLPAAAAYIFTGLKLGFVYALIGVLASEFILSNSGLGYAVSFNYRNFATAEMYAVILLVVILAVAANLVLIKMEDRLYRRSEL